MTLQDVFQSTQAILPLAVLVMWATLLILVEAFVPRHRNWLTALLAALGMLVSLVLLLVQASQAQQAAFNNMLAVDGFAVFLQALFLISGLVAIALSYDYLIRSEIDRAYAARELVIRQSRCTH